MTNARKRPAIFTAISNQPEPSPIVLDLFCGAGGLSLGFEQAGYCIGLGVEKDELPAKTHQLNFGGRCFVGDVRNIANPRQFTLDQGLPRVDVVIGGPPCQGFTRVGRGKLRSVYGDPTFVHDLRNTYYLEFLRFVAALRPLYFVMENVPDFQYYHDGEELVIERATRMFRETEPGYTVDWCVLHADEYGVPQTRKRLFIIGNRLGSAIKWPESSHKGRVVTVWDAISDLPLIDHNHRLDELIYSSRNPLTPYQKSMRYKAGLMLYNHQTRWHNASDLEAFASMPEGGKYVDLPDRFKRYRDDVFKDKYRKLLRDAPSWTIEAHIGKDSYRHIYPSRTEESESPRTISVREAARLQSFPDRFRFVGPFTRQFSQVGNAVPPLLARAVADAILADVKAGVSGSGLACAL